MTVEIFLALVGYAFVTSVTPGPNNLMLMASGANFGFRRTGPHMLGVALGFMAMVALIGLGVGQLVRTWPAAMLALKIASVLYMLWLAWKIAHAAPPGDGKAGGTPLTFLQAAAFQWVNPKAWAMALGALAVYAPDATRAQVLVVAVTFAAVNLPSVSLWCLGGLQIRRWLTDRQRLRVFNLTMAALLVASLWPVLKI